MQIPMKKTLITFISLLFLCACNSRYEYVEIAEKTDLFGGKERVEKKKEVIYSKNDTLAYMEAYKIYCRSCKVYDDMSAEIDFPIDRPVEFHLYNNKGVDISSFISFVTKDEFQVSCREQIYSLPNSIKKAKENNEVKKKEEFIANANIDSVKIRELIPLFHIETDEFDPKKPTWYQPKFKKYNNVYCYFQTVNDIPRNLRITMTYYAEDWLFIRKVQFLIDGTAYEMIPREVKRDHESGDIWEWIDDPVNDRNIAIVKALYNCSEARVKYKGENYDDIYTIHQEEIDAVKRTIDLYTAMGGKFW